RNVPVSRAFAHSGPRSRFLRRHVTILPARRRAVRNPLEFLDPAVGNALHFAGSGVDSPEKLMAFLRKRSVRQSASRAQNPKERTTTRHGISFRIATSISR